MISRAGWRMPFIAVVFFVGSFAGTLATRSQTPTTEPVDEQPAPPLACWLQLEPEQARAVRDIDPAFTEERWSMQRALDQARTDLAALFEEEGASDDALRQQVEAVIEKHNALERRVAEHLIAVRGHLPPVDQKKLYCLCAKRVRGCRSRCWGQGPGGGCSCGKSCGPGLNAGGGRGCAPVQASPGGEKMNGCRQNVGTGPRGNNNGRGPRGGASGKTE